MTMVFDKVQSLLEAGGFSYKLHEHRPVRTIDDAVLHVPHLTENLLKTVVFRIKDSHWILAAVAGQARIHYKRLGDACGVNRKQLRSVSPEEVETELGFEIGGTGPFPVADNVTVVLDQEASELGRVFCGSGRNTLTVEMEISDLIKIINPVISPITR